MYLSILRSSALSGGRHERNTQRRMSAASDLSVYDDSLTRSFLVIEKAQASAVRHPVNDDG